MNVILVDDNDFIRATLTDYLSDCGVDVADTADPDTALLLLRETEKPVVLVTDINLGCRIDGFDLAVAARQAQPSLPVVYMTGYRNNFERFSAGPADRFMSKPFSLAELLFAINDVSV